MNVSYRVLKSNVIKACRQVGDSMKFEVDYEKLKELTEDIGLIPVKVGMESKRVDDILVPYLSEYFEKTKLSWFTNSKYSTIVCFVDASAVDSECRELLAKMHIPREDDPDIDHVNIYATIVAKYPCYFANIISYHNEDPRRGGRPSYEIACRANKVVIKSSNYQYNPKDFS